MPGGHRSFTPRLPASQFVLASLRPHCHASAPVPDAPRNPAVLFLCVHNAGRSQMAAGFARHLGDGRVTVFSGGSEPASQINPSAVAAMAEVGVDITSQQPQVWSMDDLEATDVVVTMGCGDTCPFIPGKQYIDWPLEDPAGQGVDAVRPIRDQIEVHVRELLMSLGVEPANA